VLFSFLIVNTKTGQNNIATVENRMITNNSRFAFGIVEDPRFPIT